MRFQFCWEHRSCEKECLVRESKAIFCWRIARTEHLCHPEVCARCSYRINWLNNEYSLQDFIAKHDRRKGMRQRKRILIVDDETNFLYALEETMHENDYNCLTAIDGEEGLFFAKEAIPDLIITDIVMPKINGYDLCRAVREDDRTAHIPIIAVSARGGKQDVDEGVRAGSDVYLVKPFAPKVLLDHISSLIQK